MNKVTKRKPVTLERRHSCRSEPPPNIHASILKYWYELYGAEIIVIDDDTIELLVESPPQTREEALRLAEYQYAYCDDIVLQGVGSLEALAATILNGQIWFFSWD
jgi:Domain of unknown function (DUF4253)